MPDTTSEKSLRQARSPKFQQQPRTLSLPNFALPDDGRQQEHQCEERRLLWQYLITGPKNFFKKRATILRDLANDGIVWSERKLGRLLADLERLGLLINLNRKGRRGPRARRILSRPSLALAYPQPRLSRESQEQRNSRINIDDKREDDRLTVTGANLQKNVADRSTNAKMAGERFCSNTKIDSFRVLLHLRFEKSEARPLGSLFSLSRLEPLLEREKASLNQYPLFLKVWRFALANWYDLKLPPLDVYHLPDLFFAVWQIANHSNPTIPVPNTFGIINQRVQARAEVQQRQDQQRSKPSPKSLHTQLCELERKEWLAQRCKDCKPPDLFDWRGSQPRPVLTEEEIKKYTALAKWLFRPTPTTATPPRPSRERR